MSGEDRVIIHYRRLRPEREQTFDQRIVQERDDVIVTLSEPLELEEPMTSHTGEVMLEDGSLALWFTFPGAWHDIGIFHRAEGRRTGLYANVLTPPEIDGRVWHTTDLFLDLWWPDGGSPVLLDSDELAEAMAANDIEAEVARRAWAEGERLLEEAGTDRWPPSVVAEWTLERALEVTRGSGA